MIAVVATASGENSRAVSASWWPVDPDRKILNGLTESEFDPRELDEPYQYFLIRPRRIQAWREANELQGRVLMRDGRWLG